jgi:putative DNA primase/helicase
MTIDAQALKDEMEEAAAREAERYAKPPETPTEPEDSISYKDIKEAFDQNEYGDASLAIRIMRNRFCFDNSAMQSYYYNCTHWIKDINNNYLREMHKVSDQFESQRAYYADKYKAAIEEVESAPEKDKSKLKEVAKGFKKSRDAYAARIQSLRGLRRVNNVWRLATSGTDSLGISGTNWNSNPLLLPCKNCVVDLETGKALKGSPEMYFNRASPIEYHGLNAEAPLWDETLAKVFRNKEDLMDYFGYFVGCSTTGLQSKDFYCAYGPEANNGKSLVFNLIDHVLGDFAGTIPVEMLLEEKFPRNPDAPSHTRMKLYGLRLAATSEAQNDQFFSLSKIKQFTSGTDRMEARSVHGKHEIEFPQSHNLVLHTNFLPKAKGQDKGFYNRLKVLPFRAKFIPPHEGPEDPGNFVWHQIPPEHLKADILKCAPGILAYFVRYAMKYLKLGAMPMAPSCVMDETEQYQNKQDFIGRFLRECCELTDGGKEQAKDIHAAFKKWSIEEEGIDPKKVWSMRMLKDYFDTRPEIQRVESRVTYYTGLRILSDRRADWGVD